MVERSVVFTVLEAPKSNNSGGGGARQHHFVAAKEKKRLQGLYALELMISRFPKGMSFCYAEITVEWKRDNHRDKENFRQSVTKPLADALTAGGWLPDDTEAEWDVRTFSFAYPETWTYPKRLTGVQVIKLVGTYQEEDTW